MCNFKSAIISQSGEIYQHPFLDSHNDIIDLFHLQDGENPHWTPIEFLPGLDVFNLDTYTFKFDAERPFWADDDWIEQAKTKLSNIIKMMIVDKDTKILVDGAYLIKPKIKISKIITSRILLAKEADLSNANLFRADLSKADLSRADLSGANLSGANLSRAKGAKGHICIGPIGSRQSFVWARWEDGIYKVHAGCFCDSVGDFKKAVKEKHKGTIYFTEYMAAIKLMEIRAKDTKPKGK